MACRMSVVTPSTDQTLGLVPRYREGWPRTTCGIAVYSVAAIETTEDGKLTIRFTSENDRDRVLTVMADRRFLKATNG